jgi:hypothetical protein
VRDDRLLLLGQPGCPVVVLVSHRFQASSCVRRLEFPRLAVRDQSLTSPSGRP